MFVHFPNINKSLYLFHIYPFTSDLTFDQHYTLQLLKDLLTVTLSKHLRIRLDKSASALCVNNSKKYLRAKFSQLKSVGETAAQGIKTPLLYSICV